MDEIIYSVTFFKTDALIKHTKKIIPLMRKKREIRIGILITIATIANIIQIDEIIPK